VCRHRYFPPRGRPPQGRPAETCDRCIDAARDRAIEEHVDRLFAAAKALNRSTMHLTDADCWGDSPLASAMGED
jgi:hypothetical protein